SSQKIADNPSPRSSVPLMAILLVLAPLSFSRYNEPAPFFTWPAPRSIVPRRVTPDSAWAEAHPMDARARADRTFFMRLLQRCGSNGRVHPHARRTGVLV